MDLFFRGSHTTNFVTCGFSRSYIQAADVPSSKVTCKSPRSPSINCRIMLAFVSMTDSITTLPTEFMTAIEILSLCTSMPIYLMLLVIKGVLSGRVELNTQNPPPKGAPFYIVEWGLRPANSYENGSELTYAVARSGEIDDAMEKPRPIYCLIRSMRVERMTEHRRVFPFGRAAIARDPD